MKKGDIVRFRHILEAILKTEGALENVSFESFASDYKIHDLVARELEIIGEAVKNVSEKTKKEIPKIEWQKIADLRNFLAHEYFRLSFDVLWRICQKDLPILKKEIEKIIKQKSLF